MLTMMRQVNQNQRYRQIPLTFTQQFQSRAMLTMMRQVTPGIPPDTVDIHPAVLASRDVDNDAPGKPEPTIPPDTVDIHPAVLESRHVDNDVPGEPEPTIPQIPLTFTQQFQSRVMLTMMRQVNQNQRYRQIPLTFTQQF